jgi:homoserine dehydrogenase
MTPQQQLDVESSNELRFPLPVRASSHAQHLPGLAGLTLEPLVTSPRRTIRIALAGCGVVGGGLVRLLHESASAISSRFAVRFVITRVLVRDTTRDRQLPIDPRLFTNDLDTFLTHDADVVIEAVGGDEPARTIALSALRRGRKLITANKELIAAHGEILDNLASANHTALDFGAAVGGSAPVISTLRDLIGASTPRSIKGILNGTSNFVISCLEKGESLETALAAARDRGLAELDCDRDLDGRDAAAKLSIIGWIAFGITPSALLVRRTSLLPALEQLVRCSQSVGGRLRLIAECTRLEDNRVVATVEPTIVPESSSFARTTFEDNRVEVDLGWSSPLSVSGPGAGAGPTAAALLSDLVRTSPPPNDRGQGAARFESASDTRDHRWLIAARVGSETLTHAAANAHVASAQPRNLGDYTLLITHPARWQRVQRLLNQLEAANTSPCVARYECVDVSEVAQ